MTAALKTESDKYIPLRCASSTGSWDALLSSYRLQTAGAKLDLSRRLNNIKITRGSNPLQGVGTRIGDLARKMCTAGFAFDHILYTI